MKKFLRLGGHIILDFRNTWVQHGESIEDRIENVEDLEQFTFQFFKTKDYKKVTHNKRHIKYSIKQYEFLMKFRETLIHTLDPMVTGKFQKSSLLTLRKLFDKVELQPIWSEENHSLNLQWKVHKDYEFAGPYIFETAKLLTSLDLRRLKKCKNHRCSHLFLDNSKNNSRSWCSMRSCGNIMKARAFKERQNEIIKP